MKAILLLIRKIIYFFWRMPLETRVLENTWLFAQLSREASGLKVGWGNGYVVLPNYHPAYEQHYDDINVSVHGGLTYSRYDEESTDYWVVGFDTAHYNDSLERWPKEAVEEETKQLELQLRYYKSFKGYLKQSIEWIKQIVHKMSLKRSKKKQ